VLRISEDTCADQKAEAIVSVQNQDGASRTPNALLSLLSPANFLASYVSRHEDDVFASPSAAFPELKVLNEDQDKSNRNYG
jgi:hypothetical protein